MRSIQSATYEATHEVTRCPRRFDRHPQAGSSRCCSQVGADSNSRQKRPQGLSGSGGDRCKGGETKRCVRKEAERFGRGGLELRVGRCSLPEQGGPIRAAGKAGIGQEQSSRVRKSSRSTLALSRLWRPAVAGRIEQHVRWRSQPQLQEGQRSSKFRWRLSIKALQEGDRVCKILHLCAAVMDLKRELLQRNAMDRKTDMTFTAIAKRVTPARQQALEGTVHAVQPMTLRG